MCHIYNMNEGPQRRHDDDLKGNNPFKLVDRFLETELEARALRSAFGWGWIDRIERSPTTLVELSALGGMPREAARLPINLLVAAGVLTPGTPFELTAGFREALACRDLIEARLWFALLAAGDVHDHFELMLTDLGAFMGRAATFDLFRYDRCFVVDADNMAASRPWVQYTSTLTRHEADACWSRISLSGARRLLDLGGNSGEFAWQACRRAPHLQATVFDLPVVVALGQEHLAGRPCAAQVNFVAGDLRKDCLPSGHDLISFKSVLHDWPDAEAGQFLDAAVSVLVPGGHLLIFERAEMPLDGTRLGFASVANLVFLPFFRTAQFYKDHLTRLGMRVTGHETVELDMPFHLILAEKPA